MTDVWSLGCVLYELAFGEQAFVDDWAVGEYVQSGELNLPFDSLTNWDDFSRTMLKKTLHHTLDAYDFMRISAEQFSNIMRNFIKLSSGPEPGTGEGGATDISLVDVDTETEPFDDGTTDDDPINPEPMESGHDPVSKRLKHTKKRTGLNRSSNTVNGGRIEKIRDFVCEICEEKFTRKPDLKRHEITHTNERKYQCPHCPLHKPFARKDALKVCHHSF